MSYSIHMNGRTRADMRGGIRVHQLRVDKKTGLEAYKHSDSKINPELSKMNINYFDDPNRFKSMRKKLDTISENRVKSGKKKLYKSANVLLTGTIQLSDDTLLKCGWVFDSDGNKLPSDKQPKRALDNVKLVYADMVQSAKKQPEIYGDIFSATLHLDESTPHVDFMSDPIDSTDIDELMARKYLNGPKGSKKGEALRKMQDSLMKYSGFKKADLERFDIVRGDSNAKKIDRIQTIKKDEKKLAEKEQELGLKLAEVKENSRRNERAKKELEEQKKALKVKVIEYNKAVEVLSTSKATQKANEDVLKAKLAEVSKTQENVSKRILEVNKRERDLNGREKEIETREEVANKKLLEASRRLKKAEELLEKFKNLKANLASTWQRVLEMVRAGELEPKKVEKVAENFDPFTEENLGEFNEEILKLANKENPKELGL